MNLKFTLNLFIFTFILVSKCVSAGLPNSDVSSALDAAARGVSRIWGLHEERRDLYVESLPENQVTVERKTNEINGLLRTATVADRVATLDEKTRILESVIAGEYTSRVISEFCYRVVDKSDRLYGHYTVLKLTQELAGYARANELFGKTIDKDNDLRFKELERLGGITKDMFKSMFDNVSRTHVKKEIREVRQRRAEFASRFSEFTDNIKSLNSAVCDATTSTFSSTGKVASKLESFKKSSEKIAYVLSLDFMKEILDQTEMKRVNQILDSEFVRSQRYGEISISNLTKRVLDSLNKSREYSNETSRAFDLSDTLSLTDFNDRFSRVDVKLEELKRMLPTKGLINKCMESLYKAYQVVVKDRSASIKTIPHDLGGGFESHRFGGFVELGQRVFGKESLDDRLNVIGKKYPYADRIPHEMARMQDAIRNDPVIKQLHIIHANECLRVLGFASGSCINEEMLKKRYRKLSLIYHPDKNKAKNAEGIFKIINSAYRHLMEEYE